jgi:Kef-type K+ transport system membrane component KefB
MDLIRSRRRHVAAISAAGIVAPFLLGGILALFLLRDPGLFDAAMMPYQAFLFTGSAMSITAFPTLARIIEERGLSKTAMGTLSLAAGSINDAAAWCFLAVVVASFGGNAVIAVAAIGGGALYAVLVVGLVRPLLKRYLDPVVRREGRMSGGVLTSVMMLLMLGAWITDVMGVYAFFGAFMLGVAVPRGLVAEELHRKIHPLAANILLPLFFVFSGLRTELGLLTSPYYLGISLADHGDERFRQSDAHHLLLVWREHGDDTR